MTKHRQNTSVKQSGKKNPISFQKPEAANRSRIKWLMAIFLVTFIALSPILKSGFINYDDDIYVTENPLIRHLDVLELFSSYYMNQYSPFAMLVMGIEFKISSEPAFIKSISVLLHLLVTFLLYKLLTSLFEKIEYVLIPVALFALHPMQVESVAWTAASMKIGSCAFFFLASLIFYVKYIENRKLGYFFLSFLLFLFSCLSKEQAIVLSAILFVIDYFKGRNFADKKLRLEKIPFIVLAVIFGLITLRASSSSGDVQSSIVSYNLLDRLLISNYSVFAYIGKLAVPLGLSAFVTYPLPKEINLLYYLSVIGLLVLVYGIYRSIKMNNRVILFGTLFFLINIGLPILSQLMGARDVMMADRYMYLPSIGLFLLLTSGIIYLRDRFRFSATLLYSGIVIYALILGACSYSRAIVWHDSISLFSDVIEKGNINGKYSPYLSLPFNNRGIALKKQGDYDAALMDYKMAVKINPQDPKSYANIGNIYFEKNDPNAAILEYNRSLAINPDQAIALSSRGAAYGMLGKYDSALQDLTRSLQMDPYPRNTYMNRSLVYFNTGKYKEALSDINKHMEINSVDLSAYGQRGLIYLNMGDVNKALPDLNAAIGYQPGVGANYLNRSLVYKELGNKSAAMQDALKAKELGMQVSEEYFTALK